MEFALIIFLFASPAVLAAVVKEVTNICNLKEFRCPDGGCVDIGRLCDGNRDCADGADEHLCHTGISTSISRDNILYRIKRQTSCRKSQWQCRDGSCISFDGKCDGVIDCVDGSDETFPLCRNNRCQSNWFRCTYGACVDGTAPCNGIKECADNSDELQPKCLKESDEIRGKFKCEDGDLIPTSSKCDGVKDCQDGSDETVRACAANHCPVYLFKCAYGACIDAESDCNGKVDCADGSDESDELCNRNSNVPVKPTPSPVRPQENVCLLPRYPDHGNYTILGNDLARPGEAFDIVYLTVTCSPGYGFTGNGSAYCYKGLWFHQIPTCERQCKLNPHPSVTYKCYLPGSDGGNRDCNEYEPNGVQVIPLCKSPNYYTPSPLPWMKCIEGSWDYVAHCSPECGRVTPSGQQLVIDGVSAKHGELPWHVGIYRKNVKPYMQICGGSIVSTTLVISAAHCFWTDVDKLLPATRYAVAAGKIYRPWNEPHDAKAQYSDVSDIKVPTGFHGAETNFQDDIALVFLSVAFVYDSYVRPICVDFDFAFNGRQLESGNLGKVCGWGYTSENGTSSQVLKVVELPYVNIDKCYTEAPPAFREFITSDKICAGYTNGTALCKGDSGGGLAFPDIQRGAERYYLRGIVSTAPNSQFNCNAFARTAFTELIKHNYFINQFLINS